MELFRCQQREPLGEVEAHLRAEQREGAGAGAVHLLDALVENLLHEVEILAHRPNLSRGGTRANYFCHVRSNYIHSGTFTVGSLTECALWSFDALSACRNTWTGRRN